MLQLDQGSRRKKHQTVLSPQNTTIFNCSASYEENIWNCVGFQHRLSICRVPKVQCHFNKFQCLFSHTNQSGSKSEQDHAGNHEYLQLLHTRNRHGDSPVSMLVGKHLLLLSPNLINQARIARSTVDRSYVKLQSRQMEPTSPQGKLI